MKDMTSYINEENIAITLRYLKFHDPKNEDRDYAIQLLESMQDLASDLAQNSKLTEEQLRQLLKSSQTRTLCSIITLRRLLLLKTQSNYSAQYLREPQDNG